MLLPSTVTEKEWNILTTLCDGLNNLRGTLKTQMVGFQSGIIQLFSLLQHANLL
jgi:hypothetical protein